MLRTLSWGVWLFLAAQVWAAPSAYDQFAQLVAKNPATGKPVQNLQELLPLLPDELRSNFTFIYNSRGPHGGLGNAELNEVDSQHPRTLLFTTDGRLVLAFTGNPAKPGYNMVEAIHFDDDKSAFALSQFVLPAAGGSDQNGVLNPAQCLRCHGQDPRPINDSYPLWPGFYGSVRDTFPKGSPELPLYREFLKTSARQVPYSLLNFPKGSSVSPYLDPKSYNPETIEAGFGELRFLPNTRLGMAWTQLNRKRLQRKLQAAPDYLRYRDGLLAGLLGCTPFPTTDADEQAVYERLYYENEDRLTRLGYRPDGPGRAELDMMELAMYPNLTQLLYLAQLLKVDTSDWSMAFETQSLSFFDGILSSMLKKKSFYLKEDFILEMLREASERDADLARYFETYGSYKHLGYDFGERLDLKKATGACSILKRRQKEKLPALEYSSAAPTEFPTWAQARQKLGLGSVPFARCTRCHEGGLDLSTGRAIPFADPAALWAVLQTKSKAGRPLAEEIRLRINGAGAGQMPPTGERLASSEARDLDSYIKYVNQLGGQTAR